jgi:hypothetical protein
MEVKERPPMTTKFVAVNLTPDARDALRHAAVVVSAELGHRVGMSDALLVIKAIADRHRDEIEDAMSKFVGKEESTS